MKPRSGETHSKIARRTRRRHAAPAINSRSEQNRRDKAVAGGKPDNNGVTQGQNAEQGNTTRHQNAEPLGKPSH